MSETMVETCVLTLGALMSRKVANDKIEKCKEVAQYFNDTKYQLTIPFYQRAYVWDKERVKILLEDLDEYLDMKSNENKPNIYLLGSLILYKNNNKNEFEVVDGQQRLVSLALILLCLESNWETSRSYEYVEQNMNTR